MTVLFSAMSAIFILFSMHISFSRGSVVTTAEKPPVNAIYNQLVVSDIHQDERSSAPLLLLLVDSLRWDHVQQFHERANRSLPGFHQLKTLGGYVERVAPVFPAECYPNILSLLTGQYPSVHGLLFTTMYDALTNRTFAFDGRSPQTPKSDWIGTTGLPNLGAKTKRTFYYHLPICKNDTTDQSNCEEYAKDHMTPAALNHTLSRALERLENGHTDVAVVYYDQLDRVGHEFGPLSDELLLETLPLLDEVLHHLVQRISASPQRVHLVVTSDHGMTEVRSTEQLDRFISRDKVKKVINRGSTVGIWPHPEHYNQVYRRLDALRSKHFLVYNQSSIPASWHTGGPLFPPILLVARPGSLIYSNYWPIEVNHYNARVPYQGAHGYEATNPDMHVPLFVMGPDVQAGAVYHGLPLDQLHTYELITSLSDHRNSATHLDLQQFSFITSMPSEGPLSRNVLMVCVTVGVLGILLCVLALLLGLWTVLRSRIRNVGPPDSVDDLDEQLIHSDSPRKSNGYHVFA